MVIVFGVLFVYGYRHYHGPKSNLTSDDTDVYEEELYTHGEKGHMT